MTTKEKGMLDIIDAQEELIGALKAEIRKLCRKNLKLRMHMQVLANHPLISASRKIRVQFSCRGEEVSQQLLTGLQN